MNAIEIHGLSKKYAHIEALKDVNLEVAKGSIYGLIGPNGAGKTTLIKALVGSIIPTSGNVKVLGMDPLKQKWELRKHIGYMPQTSSLYEDLSARDNLLFFAKAQNITDLEQKVNDILNFTELTARAKDPVRTFSGGMKKRISLACALIHDPDILFLDEPTAAVDPHLKLRSWELFRKLSARGVTLFISTHLMDEALLCHKVAILRNGELIVVDSPQHILESGKTTIKVSINGEVQQIISKSDPESLAQALKKFGFNDKANAISFHSDYFEDIILSIINQNQNIK